MLSQLVKNVDVFITPKHKMQLGYTFLLSIPALTLKRWGGGVKTPEITILNLQTAENWDWRLKKWLSDLHGCPFNHCLIKNERDILIFLSENW